MLGTGGLVVFIDCYGCCGLDKCTNHLRSTYGGHCMDKLSKKKHGFVCLNWAKMGTGWAVLEVKFYSYNRPWVGIHFKVTSLRGNRKRGLVFVRCVLFVYMCLLLCKELKGSCTYFWWVYRCGMNSSSVRTLRWSIHVTYKVLCRE